MDPAKEKMLARELGSIVNHRVLLVSDSLATFSMGCVGAVVETACKRKLAPPVGDEKGPMYDAIRFGRPAKGEMMCEKCAFLTDLAKMNQATASRR